MAFSYAGLGPSVGAADRVPQLPRNRQLPYAPSEVGQRFRGVIDAEINARILPLFACPTPVAGEPILFEEAPSIIAPTIVSAVRTKIRGQ